jgi:hypothetical protein
MELGMREPYIEGVAIHGAPESCVGDPRGRSEALTGARAGWAIEPRDQRFRVPTPLNEAEGHVHGCVFASRRGTLRGQRTWARTEISMRENREVPRSPAVSTDASSWMVRGVVDRHWRVVRGTFRR